DGLSEQAMGFSSLLNFTGDTTERVEKLKITMDGLIGAERLKITEGNEKIRDAELLLTESLIRYVRNNFEKGYVKRKEMERFIPFKKEDPIELADSLLNKKHKDDKYFSDVNKPFGLLQEQLQKYVDIAKSNRWMPIEENPKIFKEGNTSPAIVAMKRDLFLLGDLSVNDSTPIFDAGLTNAIKSFQS